MLSVKDVFIYMFPGIMYFWIFFFGQGPMKEVLDERAEHTLARLMASPVTLSQFLLSKMLRCLLLCVCLQWFLLAVSAVFFDVRWGHFGWVTLVSLISGFSTTGILSLLFALARSREQAHSLSIVVSVGCAIVGGSFMPFENLPGFMQALGRFTPNHWSIQAFQTLAWYGDRDTVVRSVFILSVIGLFGSGLAFVLFRRRLSRRGCL